MSDYGILIKNLDGGVQIDSFYRNYFFKESGMEAGSTGGVSFSLTSVTKNIIFAWKPSSTYFFTFYKHYELYYLGEEEVSRMLGLTEISTASDIYWMIFIEENQESLPDYGLIIKNSSDEIVFTSEEKYMKIIGVYTGTQAQGNIDDITVNDADNNYFILVDSLMWKMLDHPTNPEGRRVYVRGLKKINSTTIRVGDFGCIDMAETSYPSIWNNNYTVIEVNK